MDDGGTGILTKRQLPLACHFSITKERERYILIIGTGFRIAQDLSHLLIVAAAEKEAHIPECGIGHKGQCLRSDLEHFLSLELRG